MSSSIVAPAILGLPLTVHCSSMGPLESLCLLLLVYSDHYGIPKTVFPFPMKTSTLPMEQWRLTRERIARSTLHWQGLRKLSIESLVSELRSLGADI